MVEFKILQYVVSTKERRKFGTKGQTVRGKDPDLYRKDKLGNVIYKPSYGKKSPMGWKLTIVFLSQRAEQTI
jgi:hypothetical protein